MNFLRIILFLFFSFCFGLLGGIWAQASLLPYMAVHQPFQDWGLIRSWNEKTIVVREVQREVIDGREGLERAVADVQKGIVAIQSSKGTRAIQGSGFIYASEGLVLTLASIVPQGYAPVVYRENREFSASEVQVLKRDATSNLALLKINQTDLPTFRLAEKEDVKLGMSVFLLGAKIQSGQVQYRVDEGIIQQITPDTFIPTITAPILAGSALFDVQGRILGLTETTSQGNFHIIPVDRLREFLQPR